MSSSDDSLEIDFKILQTRSSQYQDLPSVAEHTSKTKKVKKSSGRQNAFKCKVHEDNNKNTWKTTHSDCNLCTRFSVVNTLKECVLPHCSKVGRIFVRQFVRHLDIQQQFKRFDSNWTFNDNSRFRIVVECPMAVCFAELL